MLEEIAYKPLAKFTVHKEPLQVAPMKCAGCGRYSSGDPQNPLTFIDMGFSLEFQGEIFICVEGCFREIMNQLGVLTREQSIDLEDRLEAADITNFHLRKQNEELSNAVGSLNRAGLISAISFASVPAAREENEPVVPTRVDPEPGGGEEGLIEPINEWGSTDLSNSESDDLLDEI